MDNLDQRDIPLLTDREIKDDILYVFIFPNFFSKKEAVIGPLRRQISLDRCFHIFNSTFKIIEDAKNNNIATLRTFHALLSRTLTSETAYELPPDRLKWIHDSWEGFKEEHPKGHVEFYKFLKQIVTCVVRVMQDELKLELKLYYSQNKDEIIMTIKCSEYNLQVQADIIDYYVQLESDDSVENYKKVAPYGDFQLRAPNGEYTFNKKIYKKYDSFGEHVQNPEDRTDLSFFQYKDKVRILLAMINSAIDMGELIENHILDSHFCLHTKNLQFLKEDWGKFRKCWKPQSLEKIRLYFGEKIAMYFAWLEYYVIWLIFPMTIGVISYVVEIIDNGIYDDKPKMNRSEVAVFVFSMILAIGSSLFTQSWSRRQNLLMWRWGTTEINEVEQQRPRFKGKYGKDPVSGQKKKIDESETKSFFKRFVGLSVSIFFIIVTIASIVTMFIYRALIVTLPGGSTFFAVVNAVQIKIMNYTYRYIARKINDWENYEFDSEYNDSLAMKLYLFQFINSYGSLFYIAFFKEYNEGCFNNNCLMELKTQLETIFIFSFVLNLVEIGLPAIQNKIRFYRQEQRQRKLRDAGEDVQEISDYERQSKLTIYETPLNDYMELIIDYGYVVMFSSAFPLVPLLAFLINLVEIRVDAYKLCYLTKRPYPAPASTIGVWESIIKTVSYIGTLTNTGIMIFTTDVFDLATNTEKLIYFMVIEHILLTLKILIGLGIPEISQVVKKGRIWSKRVAKEKIYNKVCDADEQRRLNNLKFEGGSKEEAILDPEEIEKNKLE